MFGRTLLLRSQSGFVLTTEGELAAARCRIIQAEISSWRDFLRRSGNPELRDNASFFRMDVDISRLRVMAAVHDLGSAQRVSRYLSLSQPAISLSVRQLEADLGVELYRRTPKGMIATAAGVTGASCAKRILSEIAKMREDIASVDGVSSGLVCVGGLAYSRNALLPGAIDRLLASNPRILVRTVEGPIGALLIAMHAGEIDARICARPESSLLEGVTVEPIVEDRMALFVSSDHPLASRRGLCARDILEYPFILPPVGTVTRNMLDRIFMEHTGRTPEGAVETSSYALIRKLLLKSHLISFRSGFEFDAEPDGRIVPLDLAFALPRRPICVLQRRGARLTSAVRDFLSVIRDIAREREQ